MSIFEKRISYKPFEYNQFDPIIEVMNKTFWIHSEIDFTSDIQDYSTALSDSEKDIIKKTLLAISQIEVSVKTFWGELYRHLPKPEINNLGATISECEVRHSEAYSRLLTVLGLEKEFDSLLNVSVISNRVNMLESLLSNKDSADPKSYVRSLLLFSILIENVSLFSQFAIILCFNRFRGKIKNVANMIAYTMIEENLHARSGIEIINIIREENPEFFEDEEFNTLIREDITKSLEVEREILDWIFSTGEIDELSKDELYSFMKYRVDVALGEIGMDTHFGTDETSNIRWFEEEAYAQTSQDFFVSKPIEYTKHDKRIEVDDLF